MGESAEHHGATPCPRDDGRQSASERSVNMGQVGAGDRRRTGSAPVASGNLS
jgi:hypothetical protein